MRLTTRSNLAMRTLMFCAVNEARTVRTAEVAKRCNASENHLGQVINLLSREGFIQTMRGRGGGLRLAQPAETIRVGAVMRIFEAGTPFAECFEADGGQCPIVAYCRLRGCLSTALDAFYAKLDDVTVRDLIAGNDGLARLFSPDPA